MRWLWALVLIFGCDASVATKNESCETCHRRDGEGIETTHAEFALHCTDCHGGDPEAVDQSSSHVAPPSATENVSDEEREARHLAWVRFRWPAEPQVMVQSCGAGSAHAAARAGCHQDLIDRMSVATHRTLVGITNIPRYEFGISSSRRPGLAVAQIQDPTFAPSAAPRFTYGSLEAVAAPSLLGKTPSDAPAMFEYALTKACTRCHLGRADSESVAGTFRGAGCAACHMPFASDGLSQSKDPVADRSEPGHVAQHVLNKPQADAVCQTCHRASNRIGLSFAGIRERLPGESLDGKMSNDSPMLGFGAGTLVLNDPATPADIHQQKGLGCVDCHRISDVHGDGRIRPNMGASVGIECHDCHGKFDATISEVDGVFRSTGGDLLPIQAEGGAFVFVARDGSTHPLTQVTTLRPNPDLQRSHAAAHGQLECYACHNGWTPNYWQVDRVLDLRKESPSYLDGAQSPGQVRDAVVSASFDRLLLGITVDGQIGTFMAENAPFSVITACNAAVETCTEDPNSLVPGRRAVDRWLGTSVEGRLSLGFRPSFAHTTPDRLQVKRCDACHPLPGGANLAQVRAVYGYGFGSPILSRTASEAIDLSRMLTNDGALLGAMGTLLASPIPADRIQKALNAEAR